MNDKLEKLVEELFRIVDGDIGMDGGFLNDNGTKLSIRSALQEAYRAGLAGATSWIRKNCEDVEKDNTKDPKPLYLVDESDLTAIDLLMKA